MPARALLITDPQRLARMLAADLIHQPERVTRTDGMDEKIPGDWIFGLVRNKDGQDVLSSFEWGRLGSMGKRFSHAKFESADERDVWKNEFRSRRCIIPFSGFFSDGNLVVSREHPTLTIAGIYNKEQRWAAMMTIFAQGPNVHLSSRGRLPLILPGNMVETWVDPEFTRPETLRRKLYTYVPDLHAETLAYPSPRLRHAG